jgi:hypothetical protein
MRGKCTPFAIQKRSKNPSARSHSTHRHYLKQEHRKSNSAYNDIAVPVSARNGFLAAIAVAATWPAAAAAGRPDLMADPEPFIRAVSKLPIPTMLADIKNAGGGSPSRMLLGMLMARLKHQARVRVGDGDVSAAA